MRFDHPWMLVAALAAAAALIAAFLRAERRRTQRDLQYSNLHFLTSALGARSWIPVIWRGGWIAALVCGALALGGPHARLPVPVRDGAVFLCIDTSGSMQSSDVLPTRAQAANAAAAAFINEAPAGTQIGIIAFSSSASIVAPLSTDRTSLKAALANVPPPNGATAIGDALQLAAENLPRRGHRVVVVITDGVNNTGIDPQSMAQRLGAQHIPVYTIGIGTPNGDIIGGEQSTIDEGALKAYADVSGGAYARADDAAQLRAALARLGRVTSLRIRDVDAAFPLAMVAVGFFAATMLAGLATGRIA